MSNMRNLMQQLANIDTPIVAKKRTLKESVQPFVPVVVHNDNVISNSISKSLVEGFGYKLYEAAPATADSIKATLSPEQLKWLGGADPTDPAIMARLKSAVPDAAAPAAAPASIGIVDPAKLAAAANSMTAPIAATMPSAGADPVKLARFKELLAKAAAVSASQENTFI